MFKIYTADKTSLKFEALYFALCEDGEVQREVSSTKMCEFKQKLDGTKWSDTKSGCTGLWGPVLKVRQV